MQQAASASCHRMDFSLAAKLLLGGAAVQKTPSQGKVTPGCRQSNRIQMGENYFSYLERASTLLRGKIPQSLTESRLAPNSRFSSGYGVKRLIVFSLTCS